MENLEVVEVVEVVEKAGLSLNAKKGIAAGIGFIVGMVAFTVGPKVVKIVGKKFKNANEKRAAKKLAKQAAKAEQN